MKDEVAEWTVFFDKVFDEAKKIIYEQHKVEEDGSGPPEILAIREIVANFPCPVRIAEISIDIEKHKHIKDEVCQIIRYDFSKIGVRSIEYYGRVDARDSERLKKLLVKSFDLGDKLFEEFYKDFMMIGWWDDECTRATQFPRYNIKDNFRKFVFDFVVYTFDPFRERIRLKFRKGVNWNSKFNLKPDPILPISEITKMHETLGVFSRFAEGAGIEELQKDVSSIQLIPSVPEDVKKVFRHAKDLYVYGFFRYNFFTIAQHYAYLALESAIKNRYYQSFGKEIVLTNEKGESVKMESIDHQTIIDFCRTRKGWNVYELKIDGEKFAFRTGELLDWLLRKGIITKWERKQCETGMRLRHLMSHLTSTQILDLGHALRALEFAVDIINKLYST